MTLDAKQRRALRDFAASLRRAHLSATAVTHYVGAVRRGLEAGDMLEPVRGSKSRGSAFVARSAITKWAEWREDGKLTARIAALPFLPHSPALGARLDSTARSMILSSTRGQGEPMRSFLALVVLSGLRVGDLFAAGRRRVEQFSGSGDHRVAAAAAALLGTTGWGTLGRLLSPAGYSASYAVLRRALAKACRGAGLPYVAPEEFRRLAMAEAPAKG